MNFRYILAVALLVVGAVQAQERTAAGAMENQMTWSALKSSVDTARAESKAANDRIDLMIACHEEFKLYAPNADAADGKGCIEQPFVKETEYVESAGWQRPSYTLACSKGRKITYAMGNVTTNPNQMACGRTGAGCDFNATATLKGKTKWDVQVDPGKYVAAFIECK